MGSNGYVKLSKEEKRARTESRRKMRACSLRTCRACGVTKRIVLFRCNDSTRCHYSHKCLACDREYVKSRYEEIKHDDSALEKKKECARAYYANNRKKVIARQKKYRETECKTARNLRQSEYERRRIDSTSDSYVARLLEVPLKDCTPELIELKRQQLKLHRILKEKNSEQR